MYFLCQYESECSEERPARRSLCSLLNLDRRHPCLLIERGGVRDRVDVEEDGGRMSRRKKAKVFIYLNNVVTVRLSQYGVR